MKQTQGSSDESMSNSMNGKMASAAMGQSAQSAQGGSTQSQSGASQSTSSSGGPAKKTQSRQQASTSKPEAKTEQKASESDQEQSSNQQTSGQNAGTTKSSHASGGTSDNQSQKGGVLHAFTANLPDEGRESIEKLMTSGKEFFTESRTYLKQYPAEAAGLLACAGAVAWAIFGTKPGRHLLEVGSPIASKWLADNLSSTFRGGQQLQ